MATVSTENLTKAVVTHLDPAPVPPKGDVLQVRFGTVKTLVDEPSCIFKEEKAGPVFVSNIGLVGDEHVFHLHGGTERAVLQYASTHYASWRCEPAPKPQLFDYGSFGENLVVDGMTEENVCIGDVYRIGDQVILQVSEPRNPCYKLIKRFQWGRALKRIQRTGRVGWLYRVLQTGYIQKGDKMILLERPNPCWSLLSLKRVLQGRNVPLELVQELSELKQLTDLVRSLAHQRLETAAKRYVLAASKDLTTRAKRLTFELKEPVTIRQPEFRPHSFAKVEFGPAKFSRSYSIVSGDLNKFTLGVALDDHSRGGSAYIHKKLKVGDEIVMTPGFNPQAENEEDNGNNQQDVSSRPVKSVAIVGGIGVTAFLPQIQDWERRALPYEVHYAVRNPEDVAFADVLPPQRTKIYAKSRNERLCVDDLIQGSTETGTFDSKFYICGPPSLMDACRRRTNSLEYPAHLLHFESFGRVGGGPLGDPFEVLVDDTDSRRKTDLTVPEDKTLLQVLREAGFDMTSSCEAGNCGACRVTLCSGEVSYRGTGLPVKDRPSAMLSCVDRGVGKIEIELD